PAAPGFRRGRLGRAVGAGDLEALDEFVMGGEAEGNGAGKDGCGDQAEQDAAQEQRVGLGPAGGVGLPLAGGVALTVTGRKGMLSAGEIGHRRKPLFLLSVAVRL
ncbi:MAG: hypothetical protein ACOC71_03165, partial [Hyphomicrobiales bacterium]